MPDDSFFPVRGEGSLTETPSEATEKGFSAPATGGEALGSMAGQTTSGLGRWLDRRVHEMGGGAHMEGSHYTPGGAGATLSAEEANKRYGLEGEHAFKEPVSEYSARSIAEGVRDREKREIVFARFSNAHSTPVNLATSMVGSMLDPVDAAAMLVPGIGEERLYAKALQAGMGMNTAVVAAKLGAGASAAMAGTAALQPLHAMLNNDELYEFGMRDALTDILYSAPFGAAMHAGVSPAIGFARAKAFGREWSYFDSVYPAQPPATPEELGGAIQRGVAAGTRDVYPTIGHVDEIVNANANMTHMMMSSAAAQLIEGRPVDISPLVPDHSVQARQLAPEAHAEWDRLETERAQLLHSGAVEDRAPEIHDPEGKVLELQRQLQGEVNKILPKSWQLKAAPELEINRAKEGLAYRLGGEPETALPEEIRSAKNIEDIGEHEAHPGKVLAYHGTKVNQPFDEFKITKEADFGVHFGTREQAHLLAGKEPKEGQPSRMYPVIIDMKNPVTIHDLQDWNVVDIWKDLKGKLPEAEYKALGEKIGRYDELMNIHNENDDEQKYYNVKMKAHQDIMNALTKAGYDGARYRNVEEGKGWSYIAFKPNTVKSALSGGKMYALGKHGVEGMADPHTRTAWISAMAVDPSLIAREESGHAIKMSGLYKPEEWSVLRDAAVNRGWLDALPKDVQDRYKEAYASRGEAGAREAMIEEAIMHRFAEGPEAWGPEGGVISRLFQRLQELLERIGNWMTDRGFRSADDVFRAMESGEISGRDTGAPHPEQRLAEIDRRMGELKPTLLDAYQKVKEANPPSPPEVAEAQKALLENGYAPGMPAKDLAEAMHEVYDPKERTSPQEIKFGELPLQLQLDEQRVAAMLNEGYKLTPEEVQDLEQSGAALQAALAGEQGYQQAAECLVMAGM